MSVMWSSGVSTIQGFLMGLSELSRVSGVR